MRNPLVSIIVPVYNSEEYLSSCLESLLMQTHTAFELLLVDDGSLDCSGSICDKYAQRDGRIRVIHKENGGVSSARNAGLDAAQGDYVTFVDSDDFVAPNHLEELQRLMGADVDIAMCHFAYYENGVTRSSGEELPAEIRLLKGSPEYIRFVSRFLSYKDNIFGSACRILWKRSLVSNTRFNSNIRVCEDLLFLLQTLEQATRLKSTNNVGYFYRANLASATKTYKKDYLHSQLNLQRELVKLFGHYWDLKPHLQLYGALLCYCALSNELSYHPIGWRENIGKVRKSELYSYFNLKNGLRLFGAKTKIKFLIVWFLVKFRLV